MNQSLHDRLLRVSCQVCFPEQTAFVTRESVTQDVGLNQRLYEWNLTNDAITGVCSECGKYAWLVASPSGDDAA